MKKGITVLSLFDGISCGQQALKELRVKVDKYYASEINVYAMKISHKHFPNTKYLGYVEDVKAKNLPKIDLILAGSPCQGFSFSGKGLNFNDPRSKLFFEFVRILNECKKLNPQVKFLLENVRMKKEWGDVISKYVKAKPIMINSAKLSAQTRHRLYWANFLIEQPKDLGIVAKDILDFPFYTGVTGIKTSDKKWKYNFNGGLNIQDLNNKFSCLLTSSGSAYPLIAIDFKKYRRATITELEKIQTLPKNYTQGIPLNERVNAIGNGWTVSVIKHILKQLYK